MKTQNLKRIFLFISFLYLPAHSQNFIQDTLEISFDNLSHEPCAAIIDTVIDKRGTQPRFLAWDEKTKHLFVPVDLLILSKKPLAAEIQQALNCGTEKTAACTLELILDEFELSKRNNSMLYPHYRLNAAIQVLHKKKDGKPVSIGRLLYESTIRRAFFGDKLKKSFESLVHKWIVHLAEDLDSLFQNLQTKKTIKSANFRSGNYSADPQNMISTLDIQRGSGGWLWDAEIIFSPREAKRCFYRDGYNIRYRRNKTYESIEFGLSCDYLFYRLSQNLLLRTKSQLMFGLSSWKELNETRHDFWDAFIADYSLSQSVIYNPLDKSAILFGLGISQDVFYIYSKKINFRFYFLLNLGLKL